jgi:NitT/TauT family transport system substrate-binding protein
MMYTRREFLNRTLLVGAASLFRPRAAAAEPPPETTRLRFGHVGAICAAPGFVAEELFAAEGFTDIQYIKVRSVPEITQVMAAGETDLGMQTILPTVMRLDAGDPLVLLAGVHVGC